MCPQTAGVPAENEARAAHSPTRPVPTSSAAPRPRTTLREGVRVGVVCRGLGRVLSCSQSEHGPSLLCLQRLGPAGTPCSPRTSGQPSPWAWLFSFQPWRLPGLAGSRPCVLLPSAVWTWRSREQQVCPGSAMVSWGAWATLITWKPSCVLAAMFFGHPPHNTSLKLAPSARLPAGTRTHLEKAARVWCGEEHRPQLLPVFPSLFVIVHLSAHLSMAQAHRTGKALKIQHRKLFEPRASVSWVLPDGWLPGGRGPAHSPGLCRDRVVSSAV